jgi:rhamnopyranosyl-N-acetylglucosaminyl-diphospho-decaprenol beta-1,3/1,4-galactofuranosyltransferase
MLTDIPSSELKKLQPGLICGLEELDSRTDSREPILAVVFATMNRRETAASCIYALMKQTRLPDLVLVADNCSIDETAQFLEAIPNLPFRLIIHPMIENRGNAGGVEEVMEMAFGLGADAVWILDDDSWPRPDALSAMVEGGLDSNVVRHALQIDPKTGRFTWPLQVFTADRGWHLVWEVSALPIGERLLSRISWTGALLPRHVREVIGPVNGDLFIRGEDEEYPWRIEKAGFTQEAVRHAIMDHPGPDNVVHFQLLGKNFFYERGLADWKYYYKVRNMVWLKRQKSSNLQALITSFVYFVFTCIFDGHERLPLLRKAVMDGFYSRLGKFKAPS